MHAHVYTNVYGFIVQSLKSTTKKHHNTERAGTDINGGPMAQGHHVTVTGQCGSVCVIQYAISCGAVVCKSSVVVKTWLKFGVHENFTQRSRIAHESVRCFSCNKLWFCNESFSYTIQLSVGLQQLVKWSKMAQTNFTIKTFSSLSCDIKKKYCLTPSAFLFLTIKMGHFDTRCTRTIKKQNKFNLPSLTNLLWTK